jgi:hypothetical protein
VLTDLERVVKCMPGFELQEVDGGQPPGRPPRRVLVDVSSKLLDQFVQSLEADVLASVVTARSVPVDSPASNTPASTPRHPDGRPGEPIDLLATAGSSVIRRIGPLVAVLAAVLWLLVRR